jgi:Rrf2 family protein
MRISAKGRYALAAATMMAQHAGNGACITVINISEKLGISKIYLEQVFALLKRGDVVTSIKGAQGGYQLSRPPAQINAYDVLLALESSLFETADETVRDKAPEIDAAIRLSVFEPLDGAVRHTLENITLYDLAAEAERQRSENAFMFYI